MKTGTIYRVPMGRERRETAQSVLIILLGLVWLGSITTAIIRITAYSNARGAAETAPARWPAEAGIPLDPARPTLLMFAHPKCPCTRASIGELEILMAQCQGLASVHILFLKPAGTSAAWARTDLWTRAAATPGAVVHEDESGAESRRFHALTSGNVLLYGPDGVLMFQGGITASRGHYGDNDGLFSLISLLRHEGPLLPTTPVYGCPIVEGACGEIKANCRNQ